MDSNDSRENAERTGAVKHGGVSLQELSNNIDAKPISGSEFAEIDLQRLGFKIVSIFDITNVRAEFAQIQ